MFASILCYNENSVPVSLYHFILALYCSSNCSFDTRPVVCIQQDRFQVIGRLGSGAYGIVLKCRDRENDQIVAVKKLYELPQTEKVSVWEIFQLWKYLSWQVTS